LTPGSRFASQQQQEVDNMSIREAPTLTPDSEIRGSEACRDLTSKNADTTPPAGNAQQRRQENELQCSFLYRVQEILAKGGILSLPVLLF